MALLPVSTNRVSTPLNSQRLLHQLQSDQLAIQRYYDQLSTGRRVLRLSDDPAAAAKAITLQREIANTEQLGRNATATEAYHRSTDSALARINDALTQARGVAVEAAQGVLSDDEREALAITVRQALDSVVTSGNAMFTEHPLLGGILHGKAAIESGDGTVRFNGSDAVGKTTVGGGTPTLLTVSGQEAIGVAAPFLEGKPLDAAMTADTRLVDLRGGRGVIPGSIELTGSGESVQLDLQDAATIGDVADMLRDVTLDGRSLSVILGADTIRVQYDDGLTGTLMVTDLPGSQLARDLRIENPDGLQPPPIIGDGLAPRVTRSTPLSELNGGAGIDLSDGIVIDRGGERVTIDFSGVQTVGDVLIRINRSGADVRAELDPHSDRLLVRGLVSGVDYSIGENGGSAATSLGIRSASADVFLSDLGGGRGIRHHASGPDLVITRPDGTPLEVELEDAETIQDVIDKIRNHPNNQDAARVQVALNAVGNGLQLTAPPDAEPIRVTQRGASDAGIRLGLIPPGQQAGTGETVGGVARLSGTDFHPRDAGGAIDTLLRLERAVREGDLPEIGRLQSRLDTDLDQSSRTRGRVGVWSRTVRELKTAVEDENVLLQAQASEAMDADMASVISNLTARQTALEASMRFVGQTANLTVLNFL